MKSKVKNPLFVSLAIILTSCLAWALTPSASVVSGFGAWTITDGPSSGNKTFNDGIAAAVSIKGKIDPPLGSTNIGNIKSAKLKSCDTTTSLGGESLDPGDYMGGANGASFTFDVKRSKLPTNCKSVEVVYEMTGGGTETVCFANPVYRKTARIIFSVLGANPSIAENYPINPMVHIENADGSLDTNYAGTVRVTASSLHGSRVKMNGGFGTGVVAITEGVGQIQIECVRAVAGDTLIFDLTGLGRINGSRSSIGVQ